MSDKVVIKRLDFIRKFMDAGVNYEEASSVYSGMLSILEDALVNRARLKFGKIGRLVPVRMPPRDVVMGFTRGKGNVVTRKKRVYHLDERTEYRFKFYREFATKHDLR